MTAAVAGTVHEALQGAIAALTAAGVASPRLDAELLLAEACDADRAWLAADPARPVGAPEGRRFGEMVRRRIAREPVAYILGRKGFRRIELAVDRRVLIPRPETELLVELAVELRPRTVLDVGTGSGAVALAVADEVADVSVRATDTSADAIAVAASNAVRLGLEDRVEFELASLWRYGTQTRQEPRKHDLVVANLPYVTVEEWRELEPEIREYEPREALVSGPTGLEAIDGLLGAIALGELPGAVGLEVGAGQAATVAELVRRAGFGHVEVHQDLAGIDRVVAGHR